VPRSCTICEHPERKAIDRALVGETSNLSVSSLFDVSESAVRRHKANHLPAKLVMAEKAHEVAEADDLIDQVRNLQQRALAILDRAEEAGELRTALAAISQARGNLELLGKLAGELAQGGQVNIHLNAEWIEIRGLIFDALQPHPQALHDVRTALAKPGVKNNGSS